MICTRVTPNDIYYMTVYPQCVHLSTLRDHCRYFIIITLNDGSERYHSVHEAAIATIASKVSYFNLEIKGDKSRFDLIYAQTWDIPDAETLLTLFMNRIPCDPWFQ